MSIIPMKYFQINSIRRSMNKIFRPHKIGTNEAVSIEMRKIQENLIR